MCVGGRVGALQYGAAQRGGGGQGDLHHGWAGQVHL